MEQEQNHGEKAIEKRVGHTEIFGLVTHGISIGIGETLESISRKSGVSIPAIQRLGLLGSNPTVNTFDSISQGIGVHIVHVLMVTQVLLYDPEFIKKILDLYENHKSGRKISSKVLDTILRVYEKVKLGEFMTMRQEGLDRMNDMSTRYRKWRIMQEGILGEIQYGSGTLPKNPSTIFINFDKKART